MARQIDEQCQTEREIVGWWEEVWKERAAHARKVERYRRWLRAHGASRNEAAERVVQTLTKHHQQRPAR